MLRAVEHRINDLKDPLVFIGIEVVRAHLPDDLGGYSSDRPASRREATAPRSGPAAPAALKSSSNKYLDTNNIRNSAASALRASHARHETGHGRAVSVKVRLRLTFSPRPSRRGRRPEVSPGGFYGTARRIQGVLDTPCTQASTTCTRICLRCPDTASP